MKRRTFITTATAMLAVPSVGLSASALPTPSVLALDTGWSSVVTRSFDIMSAYRFGLDQQAGAFGFSPGAFDSHASLKNTVKTAVANHGTPALCARASCVGTIYDALCHNVGVCMQKHRSLLLVPQDALLGQTLLETITARQYAELLHAKRAITAGLFRFHA